MLSLSCAGGAKAGTEIWLLHAATSCIACICTRARTLFT